MKIPQEQSSWQQRSSLKRFKRSDEQDKVLKNGQLFNAIRKNKPKEEKLAKIKKYLDEGADVNAQDANDKNNTPIHLAVLKGELKIIEFLLSKEARIDIKNNDGETSLDVAKRSNTPNSQEVINILEGHINSLSQPSGQQVSVEQSSFVNIPKLGSNIQLQPIPTATNRVVLFLEDEQNHD